MLLLLRISGWIIVLAIRLISRVIPLGVCSLWIWQEWMASYDTASQTAHWAHIGGALGAVLYLGWNRTKIKGCIKNKGPTIS